MSKNPLTRILEANIFNRTNYSDWLQNLRIVLDFENQTYVLDRSLFRALPKESTHEERLTFEKWHEDNRKVRSIVLGSMTNDIQKARALLLPRWAWTKERGRRFNSHGFQKMFALTVVKRGIGRGSVLNSSLIKVQFVIES
ncbi:UNVERIFIED_CONTAM: hypothetical protein Sradi_3027500 [Sesamum radiatum]|uniref:Retrotransposon Copia-like N-terminal domain-containing protein n=1 Tax=Sesamum radiatum TaxID=300843 RepID=A0AAW2S2P3_SESRA